MRSGYGVGVGVGVFTVSFAFLLVTLPATLLTTTEKKLPLSSAVAGGVVYEGSVAPEISRLFFRH